MCKEGSCCVPRKPSVFDRSSLQQVGIQALSGVLFLATMGQIMGDVMADTLVSTDFCARDTVPVQYSIN